jgi:hypothetical protein
LYDGTDWRYTNITQTEVLNAWNYITAIYNNGDLETHLYLNGQECTYSRQDVGLPSFQDYEDLNLGAYTAGQLSQGLIDDVRIYNRALSAVEIQEMYNGGK